MSEKFRFVWMTLDGGLLTFFDVHCRIRSVRGANNDYGYLTVTKSL
jgi:hypothetical protein